MPTKPVVDGPTEDHEVGPGAGGQPDQWSVRRQDDNGNRFEVARRESRAEAEDLAATTKRAATSTRTGSRPRLNDQPAGGLNEASPAY
jgi:hypothetical protein